MSGEMVHKVRYLFPGSLFAEESVRQLPVRSVEAARAEAPRGAFCFVLFDTLTPPDLGPDFRVSPVSQNESGRYYLGGELNDRASVEALGLDILASNMRANDWDQVIQCVTGNWQPFTDDDVLLAAPSQRTGGGS